MADHPVVLVDNDDRRRSRLTTFFRYLLVIPHIIWLYLWMIAASVVMIINWFATLIMGTPPEGLHGFLSRFLRYSTHVSVYLNLLANPYPGFGSSDAYPVTLELPPAEKQNRLVTFFRFLLAIPAFILAAILNWLLGILAFISWFVCLILGRMPDGLEKLGLTCMRFQVRTMAYTMLITARYPSVD
jgi:hypothetical protein